MMPIKMLKVMLLIGLWILFSACSTSKQPGFSAKAQNKEESESELGVRYLLGRGVLKDEAKAFYYFSEAAKEDDPFAQNELAYLYASGKGTSSDPERAFYWYQKAADHDLASAQYNLGIMYLAGFGAPGNRALALKWLQKSAAHGFLPARSMLARSSF